MKGKIILSVATALVIGIGLFAASFVPAFAANSSKSTPACKKTNCNLTVKHKHGNKTYKGHKLNDGHKHKRCNKSSCTLKKNHKHGNRVNRGHTPNDGHKHPACKANNCAKTNNHSHKGHCYSGHSGGGGHHDDGGHGGCH